MANVYFTKDVHDAIIQIAMELMEMNNLKREELKILEKIYLNQGE